MQTLLGRYEECRLFAESSSAETVRVERCGGRVGNGGGRVGVPYAEIVGDGEARS